MKIKTINVIIEKEYEPTEIHSYFIADNLPATKINESVSEAMEKFRTSIENIISEYGLDKITEEEMAEAMENEFWVFDEGSVDIVRSEV